MFTGLVTAVGTVRAVRRTARALAITIAAPYRGLSVGESVAVDGVCLTVARRARGSFTVEVIAATRRRTTIGGWASGRRVNLERALRPADRLGGHLVSGHVDGVGRIVSVRRSGDAELVEVRVPSDVARVTVLHGSITLDGVSLTVDALPRPGVVRVALIPHTRVHTTLGSAKVGRRIHLEADMIGKYVDRLLGPQRGPAARRRAVAGGR